MIRIDRTMSREVYKSLRGNNELSLCGCEARNNLASLIRKARRAEDSQRDALRLREMIMSLDYHLCQCDQGMSHDMLEPKLNGRMKHR